MAEFATTVVGLLVLRDWQEALGVTQVAMQATGASAAIGLYQHTSIVTL